MGYVSCFCFGTWTTLALWPRQMITLPYDGGGSPSAVFGAAVAGTSWLCRSARLSTVDVEALAAMAWPTVFGFFVYHLWMLLNGMTSLDCMLWSGSCFRHRPVGRRNGREYAGVVGPTSSTSWARTCSAGS